MLTCVQSFHKKTTDTLLSKVHLSYNQSFHYRTGVTDSLKWGAFHHSRITGGNPLPEKRSSAEYSYTHAHTCSAVTDNTGYPICLVHVSMTSATGFELARDRLAQRSSERVYSNNLTNNPKWQNIIYTRSLYFQCLGWNSRSQLANLNWKKIVNKKKYAKHSYQSRHCCT